MMPKDVGFPHVVCLRFNECDHDFMKLVTSHHY